MKKSTVSTIFYTALVFIAIVSLASLIVSFIPIHYRTN